VYSFVPTERANFAKLRDAAAARIATLHVTLYGDDEVIASESNHSKLWQVLTSTRELRSLAKDPVLGSVAGVLNGKAEKFRSIFASDEYGDVQPKLELEEIEDVASGFGLTGAAPKAQNPGVEQAILQYAKTNKITRDQAYAKLKAMPKSQQQSALAKAAADAKAATTPAQPSSAGRAVQGAPTKFTEITPAGKEALSKQLTVDKFNETLNAAAALQRPTNMQAAVESYGRAGLNSKVEDLNAMYAIAKAQGQDVTALEKAAETKGIKLDKTWTVQGLSGGKNNNEYVQVTGSKGELHFRNVQSGATQTWVKPDEKFSNEALKSIKDKGVSSTGPEKTAANTSVTFDVNRTMYVEGGAVQAGRWRADTVDGNKGVVATTLGTKFNDGKDGVMVPYKTSLKDNLVTIDTTGKAGEEARANTTQALAAANANLRKEGLAYCNKAKELEAQAAALQGKLDSVTNEYINPENDHSNKVTDGALKDSMAAIKKQQDDLRAQAKQFNVALEANKVEQEKNIKIAEETGLYDDDKLKAELQAERDKIKTTCGTGSALVGFDLQGCDPAEAVAANPDGTKTLEASDLPVDQKAESTPTPGGDDAPGDATAAKGDTSTAGESSTASEPASGPTATAAASDATVVPTTADPSAFPGANPVVEETKEFVDPQGNDPMVTAEPLDSLAATRADAAVGAAEAAAGAIDKSAAGDTSTFAKPGGGFNTNLMGNEIMGASVDPLAPVAMDFSNVSNGSTLGTAGGGQVPVDVDASFFGPVDNAVSSNSSPTLYSDPFTAAPASDDFMTFDNVQSPPSNSPPYSFPATDPVSYDAPVFHDTTSYADSFPPAEPDYGAMAGDPAPMPEMSSPAPSYDAPMEMGPSDGTMMSLTDDEPSAKPAVQEGDK
jgi:hypothetical protein